MSRYSTYISIGKNRMVKKKCFEQCFTNDNLVMNDNNDQRQFRLNNFCIEIDNKKKISHLLTHN